MSIKTSVCFPLRIARFLQERGFITADNGNSAKVNVLTEQLYFSRDLGPVKRFHLFNRRKLQHVGLVQFHPSRSVTDIRILVAGESLMPEMEQLAKELHRFLGGDKPVPTPNFLLQKNQVVNISVILGWEDESFEVK